MYSLNGIPFKKKSERTDKRTDGQTNERTDGRSDYIMPQILKFGGIKIRKVNEICTSGDSDLLKCSPQQGYER